MMKITIVGPQGTGKTRSAEVIKRVIIFSDPRARVVIREEGVAEGVEGATHEIETRN